MMDGNQGKTLTWGGIEIGGEGRMPHRNIFQIKAVAQDAVSKNKVPLSTSKCHPCQYNQNKIHPKGQSSYNLSY